MLTRTDPASGGTTAYTIPYLDLSEKEVAVVYDRKQAKYPASYVSLFYPAGMEMGMGQTTVTGKVPPLWAVPGNARGSVLVKKLNVKAADGTFAYASSGPHLAIAPAAPALPRAALDAAILATTENLNDGWVATLDGDLPPGSTVK